MQKNHDSVVIIVVIVKFSCPQKDFDIVIG